MLLRCCFVRRGGAEVARGGAGGDRAASDTAQQRRGAIGVAGVAGGAPRGPHARCRPRTGTRAPRAPRTPPRLRTRTFQAAYDEQQSWVCVPGTAGVRNSWGTRMIASHVSACCAFITREHLCRIVKNTY